MKRVALPTLHKKGDQIIPAFRGVTDFDITEVAIDTDAFGTFSGETPRTLSPLDTAIAKAKEALAITGWEGAIASEGSIGSDPLVPFVTSDREVIVYVDGSDGTVIHESYRSFEIIAARIELKPGEALEPFLNEADFPRHGLIVSATKEDGRFIVKGLTDRASLDLAIDQAFSLTKEGHIVIESDLRAHLSPSRQVNIARAAERLAAQIQRCCPLCASPGWGVVDYERGVECGECGHIDRRIAVREINGCVRCDHRASGALLRERIEAAECERCNP